MCVTGDYVLGGHSTFLNAIPCLKTTLLFCQDLPFKAPEWS